MNSRIILIAVVVILILGAGALLLTRNSVTPTPDTSAIPTAVMTQETPTTAPSDAMESTVSGETTGTVKEIIVTGSNFKFVPATITVNLGDTVRVTFVNSGGTHNFSLDEFDIQTATLQGGTEETVEFVADQKGSFEYYCSIGTHRQMGMKGTLIVK